MVQGRAVPVNGNASADTKPTHFSDPFRAVQRFGHGPIYGHMKLRTCLSITALLTLQQAAFAADELRLSALDLAGVTQDWGNARADKSVDGKTITIGKKT